LHTAVTPHTDAVPMTLALTILFAYFAGSIPSALWIGRAVRGIDIRQHGSGNVGAANAWRVLGARWGLLSALIDIAKGFVPVWFFAPFAFGTINWPPVTIPILLGVVAVIGHLFPIFAGFRGGKGVLTALGVFLALLPVEVGIAVATWGIVFAASRIVSLGSLCAALAFVAAVLIRRYVFEIHIPDTIVGMAILLMILVFFTHRANIKRLISGTEHRFNRSKSDQ